MLVVLKNRLNLIYADDSFINQSNTACYNIEFMLLPLNKVIKILSTENNIFRK